MADRSPPFHTSFEEAADDRAVVLFESHQTLPFCWFPESRAEPGSPSDPGHEDPRARPPRAASRRGSGAAVPAAAAARVQVPRYLSISSLASRRQAVKQEAGPRPAGHASERADHPYLHHHREHGRAQVSHPDRRLGARLSGAPCTVGDPTTAEHAAARPVCLCIASARSDGPLAAIRSPADCCLTRMAGIRNLVGAVSGFGSGAGRVRGDGAARAAWDAGRGCGRGCWPGLRVAAVVRPARRRHPGAWLAGFLISECFASGCGGGGAGPGFW